MGGRISTVQGAHIQTLGAVYLGNYPPSTLGLMVEFHRTAPHHCCAVCPLTASLLRASCGQHLCSVCSACCVRTCVSPPAQCPFTASLLDSP